MKLNKRVLFVIGCLGVVIGSGGCANNSTVSKDEAVVKEATVKPVAATPPAQKPDEAKPAIAAAPAESARPASDQAAVRNELEKVYFNFDSYDLSSEARDVLTRNANMLLKDLQSAKLSIEGNCDERGSAEYNLALGERRAAAAAAYLKTLGVSPDRISIVSYGKERPAVQGDDETAWSKNRRDEFVVQK